MYTRLKSYLRYVYVQLHPKSAGQSEAGDRCTRRPVVLHVQDMDVYVLAIYLTYTVIDVS
jgi:hypothetical protein